MKKTSVFRGVITFCGEPDVRMLGVDLKMSEIRRFTKVNTTFGKGD